MTASVRPGLSLARHFRRGPLTGYDAPQPVGNAMKRRSRAGGNALDKPFDGVRREWPAAVSGKDVPAIGSVSPFAEISRVASYGLANLRRNGPRQSTQFLRKWQTTTKHIHRRST